MAEEIDLAVRNGEQTYAEGILQKAGTVGAGAILDLIGETVISGGRGLSAVTPDVIEKPITAGATGAAVAFLDTTVGKAGLDAAKAGAGAWFEFKDANPRAARNIEAIVDIGLLVAPVKKPPVKSGTSVIGKAGQSITEKGIKQTAKTKVAFVDDLIRPKETLSVKTEQVRRTAEKGLLTSKKVVPTVRETAIAKEVAKLPVSKNSTLQGNYNIIAKEVTKESDELINALAKNDVLIPKKEFSKALDDVVVRLSENPLLVGDAQVTAKKIVEKMKSISLKNKGSASGLLKSRKELDSWIRSQKGSNIFDPKSENALSIALREVRQTTNDFIELKTPNVAVKQSLTKQSNLLNAMDNIAPKAAGEAGNVVKRSLQNALRVIPVKNEIVQAIALAAGVGGLGAAAQFAPFVRNIIFGGMAVYGGGKAIMSPTTKKALGQLLKVTDDAIRKTKDEALLKQMRADRALVLELIKLTEEE